MAAWRLAFRLTNADVPTNSVAPDRPAFAQVAELVDALASGASGRKAVKVRVLSWAPIRGLRGGKKIDRAPQPKSSRSVQIQNV